MVSVPLPSSGAQPRAGTQSLRKKGALQVAAAASGAALLAGLASQRLRTTPVQKARKDLVLELSQAQPRAKVVEGCVDALLASRERIDEAVALTGGAWQVVHSRSGQWTPADWLLVGNPKATQEFQPAGRRVVNRGQLGPWEALYLTTEGTYEPEEGAASALAQGKALKVHITSGALHCWGQKIPLPLRGEGQLSVAYADEAVRVIKAKGGAVTVQVRQDRLSTLLRRPAQQQKPVEKP